MKVVEANAITGEITERDLTDSEFVQRVTDELEELSRQYAEEEARYYAAQAEASAIEKLLALGLTVDEVAALRGARP